MINNFKGKYGWLSNFSYHGFWYGGVWYPTNEHFFQAMKNLDQKQRVAISKAPGPGITKKMASENGYRMPDGSLFKIVLRDDWDKIKLDVMKYGLNKKTNLHTKVAENLITTYPQRLEEGNWWHDNYWGNCSCNRCKNVPGKNMLGILWETRRIELINRRRYL